MKKQNSQNSYKLLFILILPLFLLSSCHKIDRMASKEEREKIREEKEAETNLDFLAQNETSKPIYITCFYYAQTAPGVRWSWHKTPVLKLENNEEKTVHFGFRPRPEDVDDVYGYIGMFEDPDDAEESIYELLDDDSKVDLDKIARLHNKKVVFFLEHYGIEGDYFYFMFLPLKETHIPSLDFPVENKTGQDLYMVLFTYERDEGETQWSFGKYDIHYLKNGETIVMDVSPIINPEDRKTVRGYLGIFTKEEKQLADDSTFETLQPNQKVNLGILSKFKDQKVVLLPREYGLIVGFSKNEPIVELSFKKVKVKNKEK